MAHHATWRASERAGPPLVIAHRGAPQHAAENTLEAFARARELGADGVELDVRLAGDGEPVVVHDADLERLAGRPDRVSAMSSRRLAQVELLGGGSIPHLADALAATRDLLVNVEIKSPRGDRRGLHIAATAALVDRVIAAIDDELGGERILISSFDPLALWRIRRRRPRYLVALLFHGGQPLPIRRAACASVLRPFALHPREDLASASAVAQWLRRGYQIHPWTVNDPERARALAAAGAHAIITDEPALVGGAVRDQVQMSKR